MDTIERMFNSITDNKYLQYITFNYMIYACLFGFNYKY